ncbi:MAG: hypothetical protein DME24_11885 [Verrucomicrobia bacterium]|nr:MAG: hypothetical protein DME24_11885 [Verrucomicrobiota bacterium]
MADPRESIKEFWIHAPTRRNNLITWDHAKLRRPVVISTGESFGRTNEAGRRDGFARRSKQLRKPFGN